MRTHLERHSLLNKKAVIHTQTAHITIISKKFLRICIVVAEELNSISTDPCKIIIASTKYKSTLMTMLAVTHMPKGTRRRLSRCARKAKPLTPKEDTT